MSSNDLRFSGFGPRADVADILTVWRAEVRCNRELDARSGAEPPKHERGAEP
jgi:hypothetical protein